MRPRGATAVTLGTAAALALGIVIPLGGVSAVLRGTSWWWQSVMLVIVVLGVAAVLRLATGSRGAVPFGGAVIAWLWLGSAIIAPGTGIAFLPTASTVGSLQSTLLQSFQDIYSQALPAQETPALVGLTVLSIGLIAVVADAVVFALRVPAFAGLAFLAVYLTPTLIRPQPIDAALFVGVAASYLLLLWVAPRRRGGVPRSGRTVRDDRSSAVRRRGMLNPLSALGLGTAAVILALTIPAVVPGLTAASFADAGHRLVRPSIFSAGVDPTIQLGADLKRSSPLLSLSYTTSSEDPLYLKLVVLTDFDGQQWVPESQYAARGFDDWMGPVPGLGDDIAAEPVVTDIQIASLRSDWLPVPYPPTNLTGVPSDWMVAPQTLTVTNLDQQETAGVGYTVRSLRVMPTAAQLENAGWTVPEALRPMLEVPAGLPPSVPGTAAAVTAGLDTNYDKAVALQQFFTSTGGFRYSLSAPSEEGYDKSDMIAMAQFLGRKAGYCVHFASTMAVMARTLGIPSRIAIGFHASNTASADASGATRYEVYTDDLHAWPELYFDGIGWLPFEPTPSIGLTVPDYSLPSFVTAPLATSTDPSAASAQPTAPTDDVVDAGASDGAATTPDAANQALIRTLLVTADIVLLVIAVLLTPLMLRRLRRRRRRIALRTAQRPAGIAWRELCDTANDYGYALSPSATPREDAQRMVRFMPAAHESVDRIVVAYEREAFARPGSPSDPSLGSGLERDLARAQRALATGADAPGRRRALFLPVSLLSRG